MERFFLLHQLIDVGDVVRVIIERMMLIMDDFTYGRMYQLVSDKSLNIVGTKYTKRVEYCEDYMGDLTFEQTVNEAYIICARERKVGQHDEWLDLEVKDHGERDDHLYFGRCVQYIICSDTTTSIESLLQKEYKRVIDKAHSMREDELLPNDGEYLDFDGCSVCQNWYVGENRCQCGNRKCYLQQTSWIKSLDESEICYYVSKR